MSSTKQSETVREDRRDFLKGLAVTGAAVGLGAAAGPVIAAPAEAPSPTKTSKQGYHETAHIRDYYRSANV